MSISFLLLLATLMLSCLFGIMVLGRWCISPFISPFKLYKSINSAPVAVGLVYSTPVEMAVNGVYFTSKNVA